MPDDKLTPEEKDKKASEAARKKKGKVDEMALLEEKKKKQATENPSGAYIWLWILVGVIVLVAIAGGMMMGFVGGKLFGPRTDYTKLLGAEIVDRRGEVLIDPVYSPGPAQSVGLQSGDVLVSIDGESITSARQAQRIVGDHRVNDSVRLVIRRGGLAPQQYVVVLGIIVERPPDPPIVIVTVEPITPPPVQQGNLGEARLGIKYRMLIPEDTFEVKEGALIISILQDGGPADQANLDVGDIIMAVNGDDLNANFTLENALGLYEPGSRVRLRVLHDGRVFEVSVTLGGG